MKFKLPKIVISPRLKSRKLWLALLSAVLPVLNDYFAWGLDVDAVTKFVQGLWLFIVAEGTADAVRALK